MEDRASRRTLAVTVAVLAAVALLAAVAVVARPDGAPPTGPRGASAAALSGTDGPPPVPPHVTVVQALAALTVLRDWDRARAAAWRAGDADALRGLYAAGSAAGRADVAMLRRWRGRGLRVRGMAMQVLAVRLTARSPRRLVLVVTDRLTGPVAVDGAGHRWRLPRDRASTRRLVLRRTATRWQVRAVYDVAGAPSPVAMTSATPRSENE